MPNLLDRITINPDQCGGRPCIRGMRIRVTDVLDLYAAGLSVAQILEELPDLEPEDLQAALLYASDPLDDLIGTLETDVPGWGDRHDYYLGQALLEELRGEG